MAQRGCPDCGVTMEPGELQGIAHTLVTEEEREGVLGAAGLHQRRDVAVHFCPECGLVRLYADVEE